MAQKNDMAMKRKLIFDTTNEVPGLVEVSDLVDEEGTIEVPGFARKVNIKDGVKIYAPLDCVYKIQNETNTQQFFYDWFNKNELHDVTIINTDGVGAEINRWTLNDCECSKYSERTYNAGGVEFFGIAITIVVTSEPVRLEI